MKLVVGLVIFLSFSLSQSTFAKAIGTEGGNGGDPCESRIQDIRNNIKNWIQQGGSKGIELPRSLSLSRYNSKMLAVMSKAKISCQEDRLFVGEAEKTCKNRNGATPFIQCNVNRFMAADESEQYMLIHHEFAGLAGFEVNSGENSNYEISDQVGGYLRDTVVKKLSIKPHYEKETSGIPTLYNGNQYGRLLTIPLKNKKILFYFFRGDWAASKNAIVYDQCGEDNPDGIACVPDPRNKKKTIVILSQRKNSYQYEVNPFFSYTMVGVNRHGDFVSKAYEIQLENHANPNWAPIDLFSSAVEFKLPILDIY